VNDSASDPGPEGVSDGRPTGNPGEVPDSTEPPHSAAQGASWWASDLGVRVRAEEQRFFDAQLPDLFGYYALQIGVAGGSVLGASRIRTQWMLDTIVSAHVLAEPDRMPFKESQFDVVALPHTLEADPLPHEVLREAYRILRPEGHLLLTGFNPVSLFGLRRYLGSSASPPWSHEFISLSRAKDWLTLLGFDLATVSLCAFGLPATRARTLDRFDRLARWGESYWPFLGGVYCIRAVKRVAGVRLLRPAWARQRSRVAPQTVPTRHASRLGANRSDKE